MALQHRRTASSLSLSLNSKLTEELGQLASVAALAIPALGIVVVDPLISLVDTACIGRTSTEQLAALAPNSSVFNLIFQARPQLSQHTTLSCVMYPVAIAIHTLFCRNGLACSSKPRTQRCRPRSAESLSAERLAAGVYVHRRRSD